jgi:hypothetical protein
MNDYGKVVSNGKTYIFAEIAEMDGDCNSSFIGAVDEDGVIEVYENSANPIVVEEMLFIKEG